MLQQHAIERLEQRIRGTSFHGEHSWYTFILKNLKGCGGNLTRQRVAAKRWAMFLKRSINVKHHRQRKTSDHKIITIHVMFTVFLFLESSLDKNMKNEAIIDIKELKDTYSWLDAHHDFIIRKDGGDRHNTSRKSLGTSTTSSPTTTPATSSSPSFSIATISVDITLKILISLYLSPRIEKQTNKKTSPRKNKKQSRFISM